MNKQVSILGVSVDCVSMEETLDKIEKSIEQKKPSLVATANAEMIMLAQKDRELFRILNEASLVIADGAGVVFAARYKKAYIKERVTGFDLTQKLLSLSNKKNYKIFLFGTSELNIKNVEQKINHLYPELNIVGVRNGFFSEHEEKEIIEQIKKANPDILFLGLGVPKQEKWIAKNLKDINVPVCIGVGGTFDIMSGSLKRAPLWMQKNHLEWLYRLYQEPKRFFRMMALPKFVFKVILEK
ncbi:WecB/TagA/CpsF family glycosyltransferase [Selenomonadales bacterium OttesenSCG-928-I06]|nr:WecB/TagA/CpsF family glycosyltransferase [Selenomonadales bacterium OttesenSCG-928-I06]